MRELIELRRQRDTETARQLDAGGRERQVAALAEIAPGRGRFGDGVAREDETAHGATESTCTGALSCRGPTSACQAR